MSSSLLLDDVHENSTDWKIDIQFCHPQVFVFKTKREKNTGRIRHVSLSQCTRKGQGHATSVEGGVPPIHIQHSEVPNVMDSDYGPLFTSSVYRIFVPSHHHLITPLHLCICPFRKVRYPWRFYLRWVVGGPGPPASGRRCAAGPGCRGCAVRGASLADGTGSWAGAAPRRSHCQSRGPSDRLWGGSGTPPPVWAL